MFSTLVVYSKLSGDRRTEIALHTLGGIITSAQYMVHMYALCLAKSIISAPEYEVEYLSSEGAASYCWDYQLLFNWRKGLRRRIFGLKKCHHG